MKATRKEQKESWLRWQEEIKALKKNRSVAPEDLKSLEIYLFRPDIIGYGEGKIRPGEIGRLDVFIALACWDGISYNTRLILAGLSEAKLEELEKLNEKGSKGSKEVKASYKSFKKIKRGLVKANKELAAVLERAIKRLKKRKLRRRKR